ncbi:hypothetical protein [Mycolicibacterium mageritense]|uniref:hypothetical protein n=1 Tax=Mycolicibacterium mageritense TaxID=53462 RepID=UPI0011D4E35F|nr:hypothetical protein [Mycolicibacterium mageritense]TXI59031.1 MAG: hypothetical protein E6Q55_22340 [Mycolicibacterium mageritense]
MSTWAKLRRLAATIVTSALALTAVATAPPVTAAATAIAPGDTIHYSSSTGGMTCTLGFVFTHAGHSLGITAGHCVYDGTGVVTDTKSGHRGRVVDYSYDPSMKGNDFALIDFGAARIEPTLLDTNLAAVEAPPADQTICHTGVASGTSCGQLSHRYGPQYLTLGHRDRAGDSGGPVWTRYGLDEIAIVGIWLGTHTDPDRTSFGRFYPLTTALQGLGVTDAAV